MKTHHSYSEDPKENRPCSPIREEHIQFNSLPTSSWEEAKKKQISTLKAVSLETSSPDADLESEAVVESSVSQVYLSRKW